MSTLDLLLCILLLSGSALLSSSEVAIFSLSRFQLRMLRDNFRPAHRRIKKLLSDPGGLLISILILNEVINIFVSSMIARAVARGWGEGGPDLLNPAPGALLSGVPPWALQTVVGTLITAPIILIFGEITPKAIGARVNQVVAPLTAPFLTWVHFALGPARFVLQTIVSTFARWIGRTGPSDVPGKNRLLKEEEFLVMVEEGHREGSVRSNELELIRNVFELDDTTVEEIYTPLSQVQTIPATTPLREAFPFIISRHFSRFPVVGSNRKQVVGLLFSKDLLREKLEAPSNDECVSSLMRKPLYVSPSTRLNSLFRKFKLSKTHMAVVEQNPGEAIGVVTMDDVLDALLEHLSSDEESEDGPKKP